MPKPHYSDLLIPGLAVVMVVVVSIAFRFVVGGLLFAVILAGALARNR